MSDKTVYDWGQAPPGAPSTKRVDPLGWILASLFAGAVVASLVLWALWRPIAGLSAPVGALSEHAGHWFKLAARLLLSGWFEADAKLYGKFWSGASDAERLAIIWRIAVGALGGCAPAMLLAPGFLRPRDGLLHLRGSRRFKGKRAVEELRARLAERVKRRPDHDIAPGVAYPADLWTRHVLVVGGVGSGKSTAMKPLIDRVVSAGEQLLLFDPKSEFTICWSRPSIMAPWDARSLAWDLARDMRNTLDMRRFAAAMIRESQDPMWSNASRQLLVGLMIHLKESRGFEWGWRELAELVALPQSGLLPIMRRCHPEAVRAVEKASVTTAGILINLSSFCSSIFDLAAAWGDAPSERRVSFVEWTAGVSRHPQIILQGHGAYAELTKSYVEGIVGIVSAMVNSVEMRDDPNRKIWFIADELPQMGRIFLALRALLEIGRSRGLRCVLACQDFAQLEELYGASPVKAMVSMSGSLLVGQMMQGDTAEALCKAFGSREVERANVSSSYQGAGGSANRSSTLSYARDEVALYKPSELASRLGLTPDGRGVKLILFTGGDAFELVWPHFQMREERSGHVPAPWTLGLAPMRKDPGAPLPESPPTRTAELRGESDVRAGRQVASSPRSAPLDAPALVGEDLVVSAVAERSTNGGDGGEMEDEAAILIEAVGGETVSPLVHFGRLVEAAVDARPGPREEVSTRQRPAKEAT